MVQRSREFDDDQPTTSPSGSNPQAPSFPQDPGPNQPLRRPDFDDDSPTTSSPTISNNTKSDFTLRKKTFRGCEFILNTAQQNQTNKKLSLISVEYLANNQSPCGQSFTVKFAQDFNKIEIEFANGERSILENLNRNDVVNFISFDYQGKSSRTEIKIPNEIREIISSIDRHDYLVSKSKSGAKNGDKACKGMEDYCKGMDKVSTNLGMLELAVAFTGPGVVLEGYLAIIDLVLNFGQLPCFATFGGDPPLPFGDLFKVLSKANKIPVNFDSKKISRFGSKMVTGMGKFMGDTVGDPELGSSIRTITAGIANGLRGRELQELIDDPKTFQKYYEQFNPKEQNLREQNRDSLTEKFFRDAGLPFSPLCQDKKDRELKVAPELPSATRIKICAVPKKFWRSHKRKIATVNMEETTCIVPGPVMTKQGEVDGQQWVGVCERTGNNTFGQPPTKKPRSQPEDPARRNPVPNCPANWGK
ncbi:hypothetical protein VB711_25645 [Cronbergia sp. UHCC 0137]|uniref:hypothetical protein n=1 Tax=Cronbergia sp. UHCC 0137 TaxID=3110239 RepID=UPI002B218A14|nr:hypothetical protein [Cronbergia sp. UHCC 0137]MEA5621192.1 hypothetical protein [Cronbergia sp. UHCC 0137]